MLYCLENNEKKKPAHVQYRCGFFSSICDLWLFEFSGTELWVKKASVHYLSRTFSSGKR